MMNLFTKTKSCGRWAPILALAFVAPAFVAPLGAQQNLVAPAGWVKSGAAGDAVFSEPDSGCRLVIKKLMPLGGNLRGWFDRQIEGDGRARGEIVMRGEVTARERGRGLTIARSGRVVRRLFYFYPGKAKDKGDVIGIGNSAFIGDN